MKGYRNYLIVTALLLTAYLVAQYYKPRPIDWTPTYQTKDKNPFGMYVLHQELKALFPDAAVTFSGQRVYNTLKNKHFTNTNYLLCASAIDMDQTDFKELLTYVKRGNNVFIASFYLPKALNKLLKLQTSSSFKFEKKAVESINFTNPALMERKGYVFDRGLGEQYFSRFDTAKVTVLGKDGKGNANFIKYAVGGGSIYLLPNPQLLSNYNLLNPRGADYVAKALSYLPPVKVLIWDEFNTVKQEAQTSVLYIIFKYVHLRWAYYLALIGLLIFVLFEMKRRQRIIPIVAPLKNSSVEFVKTVGKVYYQQRDNNDIARKKISYFLEHIRSAYHLRTTETDAALEEALSIRAGVDIQTINQLFTIIRHVNNHRDVDDYLLINLNDLIEQFYKQAL